jgi:hypothetical protein
MRPLALLVFVGLLLGLVACGGSNPGSATAVEVTHRKPPPQGPTVRMAKAEIAKLPPLRPFAPKGPPPKHLKIIDLRKGSGPGVPKHDWVTNKEEVFYRFIEALSYKGAREGRYIGPYRRSNVLLEYSDKAVRLGLTGMKVGGRRVLIAPPQTTYAHWKPSWGYAGYVTTFVIDLVGIEPPQDRRVEYRNRPFGKQG